ncbi:MAG: PRC-barrel domain-containing protein [Solirubrobacterales bacterium]
MPEAAALPTREEARAWVGTELSDRDGKGVGRVEGFYADAGSDQPVWMIARLGRRRSTRIVAVPLRECAGAPFGVWVAQPGEALRTAPVVDPERPLRREHELAISSHFGIGEAVGRAAEVVGRGEGEVTAAPLAG